MELTGTWKPYGKYVNKDQKIIIQDYEITFWTDSVSSNSKQATASFHLEEGGSLKENHCYNIKIDDEQYKNIDFMVHEEIIDGKPVVILSHMDMEYDGRGRIVFFSYVREEDYTLVNDEFKSLAYLYWNERPPVSKMQKNPNEYMAMSMTLGSLESGFLMQK